MLPDGLPTIAARVLLGLFFACNNLAAEDIAATKRLQSLAQDPQWLRLGHYRESWLGTLESDVDDERFFLSDEGKTDPLAELGATYSALANAEENGDRSALCRFPARALWLQSHFPGAVHWSIDRCAEMNTWRQKIKPDSISLIFPSSYINSPSSMFGHTLLRLDTTIGDNHVLLSWALNYGATADVGNEGGLLYAVKGLTGGYQGTFNLVPYFEKVNEYNDLDNRNIFEYKLGLSRSEIEFLLLHTWELKSIEFDYYYFDENCAYQLLALLEVAKPELTLTDQFKLKAIPADTVRVIEQAGLIKEVVYRPAAKTQFEARTKNFTREEINLTKQLTLNFDEAYPELKQLPANRRYALVDAAYRYARLRANEFGEHEPMREPSFNLLHAINAEDASGFEEPVITLERVEHGHASQRLGISGLYDEQLHEGGLRIEYRPVYHDWLDPVYGYVKGADIEILTTAINLGENAVELDQLTLAQVESLRIVTPFFRQMSWFAGGGLTRKLSQPNRVNGYIQTGRGYAKALAGATFYGFGAVRYETHNGLMPGARLGLVHNSKLALKLELNGYYSFVRDHENILFDSEIRYPLSNNFALAASYTAEWDGTERWPRAQVGAYWYFN